MKIFALLFGMTFLGANAYAEDAGAEKTFVVTPEPAKTCASILEFERLNIDPKTGSVSINSGDKQKWILLGEYKETVAWLSGFMAALDKGGSADDSGPPTWLTGIYSYCKANPGVTIRQVAADLTTTVSGASNKN
jgi:hypothetical protein